MPSVPEIMVGAGAVAVLAAAVGGGLKASGWEMPLVNSLPRQVILALIGAALIAAGLIVEGQDGRLVESNAIAGNVSEPQTMDKEAAKSSPRRVSVSETFIIEQNSVKPWRNLGIHVGAITWDAINGVWVVDIKVFGENGIPSFQYAQGAALLNVEAANCDPVIIGVQRIEPAGGAQPRETSSLSSNDAQAQRGVGGRVTLGISGLCDP